ncbi:MAG: hypothetical protein U0Q16_29915 [Bryobacteraceae bacterium]
MQSHVRALGVLTIIHASLLFTFGLTGLLFFGGLAAFTERELIPIGMTVPVLTRGLGFALGLGTLISVFKLAAGIGLLYWKQWARILAIVASVAGIWEFPVGTLLGGYGLWVLTNKEASALFKR